MYIKQPFTIKEKIKYIYKVHALLENRTNKNYFQ